MSEIVYLTDVALITCICGKERTEAVLHAARDVGARGAIIHTVNGWGVRERLGAWGVAAEAEKDVVEFLVSTDQQDLIFDAIYQVAELNEPGRGFMYVSTIEKGAIYLPDRIRKQWAEALK